MLLVQIVRLPEDGVEAFRRFESEVLPLLPRYGAHLERRLRALDGRVEVHIVSFPSGEALERYRTDPVRQSHLHLLHASHAAPELLEVMDVTDEAMP